MKLAHKLSLLLGFAAALSLPGSALAQAPVIEQFTPTASRVHLDWGESIVFQVTASGESNTYEWYRNDALLSGSYRPSLSVDNVTASDGGRYRVIVRNAEGSANGPTVHVAIDWLNSPSISNVTPDFTLTEGEPFTLEASWTGTLPATIEWSKDGDIIQTGSSNKLTVDSPTPADGGTYTVRITNPAGYDTRTLTVDPVPASSRLPRFLTTPADFSAETGDDRKSVSFQIAGEFPIQCDLLHDGQIVSTSTTNQSDAALDLPLVEVSLFGDYTIRLTNEAGTVSSGVFRMSREAPTPPAFASFNQWPPERTTITGSSIYLSPVIVGSEPKTFQWFKNQQVIPEATASSLWIIDASAEDQGSYALRVSNPAGIFTTPAVTVVVTATQNEAPRVGISNYTASEYAIGESIYLSSYIVGTQPITYQWTHDGVIIPNATESSYSFEIDSEADYGNYHLIATNAFGTARTHVRTLVPRTPFPPIITNDLVPSYAFTVDGGDQVLTAGATGASPMTYQWYRDGEVIPGATGGGLLLGQTNTPPDHNYHLVVTNPDGTAVSSTCRVVSADSVLPVIPSHPQHLHLFTDGNGYLRIGQSPNQRVTIAWFKDGELLPGQSDYNLSIGGESAAGDYHATLTNSAGTVTTEIAHVTYGDVPPTPFLRSPGSLSINYNGNYPSSLHDPGIQFETLDTPVAIKWFRDGSELPGQTSNRLLDGLLGDNVEGTYIARVTTATGDFDTPPIHITAIRAGSVPAMQPNGQNFARAIGSGVNLYGGATSPRPMTFQWFHNGELMPFANTDLLQLPTVTESDLGQYTLQATNTFGTSETVIFNLTAFPISTPNVITPETAIEMLNPSSSPDSRRIRVYVTGQNIPDYQWFKDGEPLAGQTRSFITLRGDVTGAAGEYQARVSNSVGTRWSEVITLTVIDNPFPFVAETETARHVLGLGESITLNAPAVYHPGPITYQWLLNGIEMTGADSSSVRVDDLTIAKTGTYSVRISDGSHTLTRDVGTIDSTNAFSPLKGRHRIVGNGVFDGQPIRIHTRLTHPGDLSDASYSLLLPTGWSLAAQDATGTSAAPNAGETDLLEWKWTTVPASPINFEFTLTPPAGTTGTEELAALLESTYQFLDFQALAMPDPVRLAPVPTRHSADVNDDGLIDLSELLRVIELYNTRNGSARTGRYALSATSTDGFAPDATEPETTESRLNRFHLADSDWDGALSLSELLRVIELYNTRAGSTRTGAYHRATGSADGFAPGTAE